MIIWNDMEADTRHRIFINLYKTSDNFTFRCLLCGNKVKNVINGFPLDVSDIYDSTTDKTLIGSRCGGRDFDNGSKRCNVWYYFKVDV